MLTVCAWCEKSMGSREPLHDPKVSHGICDVCLERESRGEAAVRAVSRDPGAELGARRPSRAPLPV